MERGQSIDGVGFQFHLEVGLSESTFARIVNNFARYHALGLSTHVTELDVRDRKPITKAKLEEQTRLYRMVIEVGIESPSTQDVMLLGFTNRCSWITEGAHYDGSFFPDHLVPTLMDNGFRYYPSFEAVREGTCMRQPPEGTIREAVRTDSKQVPSRAGNLGEAAF